MEGHEGRLKPETAALTKTQQRQGVFCFVGVGCSAPSPCTGARSHQYQETKYPPVLGFTFLKTENIMNLFCGHVKYLGGLIF